eukprot:Pompholyxophrys_punicea_v1_NODE_568_length_1676_cov_8.374460.p2 type:complete len:112 gc:universal NODE_568_length_1676_cov_8.374460:727-392(-)
MNYCRIYKNNFHFFGLEIPIFHLFGFLDIPLFHFFGFLEIPLFHFFGFLEIRLFHFFGFLEILIFHFFGFLETPLFHFFFLEIPIVDILKFFFDILEVGGCIHSACRDMLH